jgi:20S proteasome alpha/beta subunit
MVDTYTERKKGTEQMITERITDIDPDITDEIDPLTTIVAIKCPDGIVMASDSQATQKVKTTKTLGVTKIFNVNNFMGVGGSGDADDTILFVDHLRQEFPRMSSTENAFRDKIQKTFWRLNKKYNLDARHYLGPNANPFNPTLLVGVKNANKSFGLYLLKNNMMVYPKNEYEVIGSGGDLARLVIKQINRSIAIVKLSLPKLPIEHAAVLSSYIINEVKESDSQSGGETKVVVINSNGVKELPSDEVQKNYNTFLEVIAKGFAPIFEGELSEEQIKKAWAKG